MTLETELYFKRKLAEVEISPSNKPSKPKELSDDEVICLKLGKLIDEIQPIKIPEPLKLHHKTRKKLQKDCLNLLKEELVNTAYIETNRWYIVNNVKLSKGEFQWFLYAKILPKLPVNEYPQVRGLLVNTIHEYFIQKDGRD